MNLQVIFRESLALDYVVAMRVSNPERSPLTIHRSNVAQAPTAFLEIVGDYLPILHAADSAAFALHTAMTK